MTTRYGHEYGSYRDVSMPGAAPHPEAEWTGGYAAQVPAEVARGNDVRSEASDARAYAQPPRGAPGAAGAGQSDTASAATTSPGEAPAGRIPQRTGGALDDEELQRHITTRMAMLTRDPRYMRMQRTLANRRRARSRLYEFNFVLDVALSLFALVVAQHYRAILSRFLPVTLYVHIFGISDTALLAGIVIVVWPVVFSILGLYNTSWITDRYSFVRVAAAVCVSSLIASGVLYFLSPALDRTRIFLIFFTVLDMALLLATRLVLRPLATIPALRRRVLIVGTGRLAVDAAHMVADRRRLGLDLVGVVGPDRDVLSETDPALLAPEERESATYRSWMAWRLGDLHKVVEIVQDREVDLVLVALAPNERYETSWVISSLAHLPVQVYVLPDVVTETAQTAVDVLDGMPVIGLTESSVTGWNARIKRVIDLVICVPMVLLLWPIMLIIAIAIRLDSSGPSLFMQERVGQHNRRFMMIKFRTMTVGADNHAQDVAVKTHRGLVHKQRNDPRVTRIGRFLRKTSLDELPQLFNILKGDMSVVGPRPELPWIVERYRAWQYRRLLVPQGLTGWWQVHGRSDRVLHLHTQDDIFYVRNYSLWLDLKILLKTIQVVLTGRGAY